MKYLIHTEGFELTDAIRDFTQERMSEIKNGIPEKVSVETFLKSEGPKTFSCTLKVNLWRRDWVVKEYGPDLYALIALAHKNLARTLHKAKEKRKALIHKRAQKVRDEAFQYEEVRL
jgi:ribosomal subunit interface protein